MTMTHLTRYATKTIEKLSAFRFAGMIVFMGLVTSMAQGQLIICNQDAEVRSELQPSEIVGLLKAKTPIETVDSNKLELDGIIYSKVKTTEMIGWVADKAICTQSKTEVPVTSRKIVVNLTENRLYYYENDILMDSWAVGTARAGKVTPVGEFRVNEKEKCPPYFGSKGDHNTPGCIPENPFGPRVLWFIGHLYGIHGTNEPWLIADSKSANTRRVSGGCIRNPNQKILWLFERVKVGDRIIITR